MYKVRKPGWVCGSLCWEGLCHVHGRGLHGPALLVVLQQPVELLQVCHDVVLDVRSGDLQPHTATVEGAREVPREHLVDHPGHNGDDLGKNKSPFFSLKAGGISLFLCRNPCPGCRDFRSTLKQTHKPILLAHVTFVFALPNHQSDCSFSGVRRHSRKEQVSVSLGSDPKPNKAGTCHLRAPVPHLHHDQLPLPGFSIRPLFSKTEVDLIWWLFLNLSLLMGNQL